MSHCIKCGTLTDSGLVLDTWRGFLVFCDKCWGNLMEEEYENID